MSEKKITVFVWLDGGFIPAGLLNYFQEGRNSYSVFHYGKRYLQRSAAIAIDPVQLPLVDKEIATEEGFDVFNGIRDAGPDRWGRYLLDKKFNHALSEIDYIIASQEDRVGALAFGDDPNQPPKAPSSQHRLDLKTCVSAIDALTKNEESEKLEKLLEYGPSLGGARPKATVDWAGKSSIAKFSISMDKRNEPLIEYAAMTLAKKCGLSVPKVEKTEALKRDIYLIERFDRIRNQNGTETPIPFISGLTATGTHESDFSQWSYRRLCEAITQLCADPEKDKAELFKRLVFNILVFNNDDHLRNHGFLYQGNQRWALSPLYDVVPTSINSETYTLSLSIGKEGKTASISNAVSAAPYFGITEKTALGFAKKMQKITNGWEAHFRKCGVSPEDIEKLRNSFKDKG